MSAEICCGDALDLLRAMPAESVDCCITDPCYGETSCEWDVRVPGWPAEVLRVLKPHGSLWVFGSLRSLIETASEFGGWKQAQDVIWEKHNGSGLHNDRFRRVHEIVVQFYPATRPWAEVFKAPQFTNDAKKRTVRRKQRPSHWGEIASGDASAYESEDGGPRLMRSVIFERSMHGRSSHETAKPPELIEPLVRYSCPEGGIVLDPFAGSGQTGIAAQRNGRDFIGIEKRPEMCAIARRLLDSDAPLLNHVAAAGAR